MTQHENIWIGPASASKKILVLGESAYGKLPAEIAGDEGYMRAYLADRVVNRAYSRISNACAKDRQSFWGSVMFTNFVQRVALKRDVRPTPEHYVEGRVRLAHLIQKYKPRAVWVLGKEQSEYAIPVLEQAGIPYEVTALPSAYRLKNEHLKASWQALLAKVE